MKKEELINEILEREWNFFTNASNVGGRASCQDNKTEFVIMRKSQWETLPQEILESYLDDLQEAENKRVNIVVEKYARMMEYSSPVEYAAIKRHLQEISYEKKEIANKIVEIYLNWEKEVMDKYPKISGKGRPLYSKSDTLETTSIETYLRGELYSYSKKTNELYYQYIKKCVEENKNLALENIRNIVIKKGFESLEEAENFL